jgi:hypothetical protein
MDIHAYSQAVLADAVKLCQKNKLKAPSGTWKQYLEVRCFPCLPPSAGCNKGACCSNWDINLTRSFHAAPSTTGP